jgi:hypothetical protein
MFSLRAAVVAAVFYLVAPEVIARPQYTGIHLVQLGSTLSLVLALIWFGLGLWAGAWIVGLVCSLSQLLAGLMAAYGGRRTELGRQNAIQILGLHVYLRKADRAELKRIQENDPEYFYNLFPFALALGVDMSFARRFGPKKMPACPYFLCGVKEKMTAEEWTLFFRETAQILDQRYQRMEVEKYAVMWMR